MKWLSLDIFPHRILCHLLPWMKDKIYHFRFWQWGHAEGDERLSTGSWHHLTLLILTISYSHVKSVKVSEWCLLTELDWFGTNDTIRAKKKKEEEKTVLSVGLCNSINTYLPRTGRSFWYGYGGRKKNGGGGGGLKEKGSFAEPKGCHKTDGGFCEFLSQRGSFAKQRMVA